MTRERSVLFRLSAAAFLADMALYLTMTGVPYKALALGASPLLLGFLPVARALPYSMTTVWAGGRTEGKNRLRLAGFTLGMAVVSMAALTMVNSLLWIYALLGVIGLSFAFFWPAVQATLADVAAGGEATGKLGWFNISWSTGKATGFIIGGFVLAGLGFGALFAAAAAAVFGVLLLVIGIKPGAETHTEQPPGSQPQPTAPAKPAPGICRRFRWAGWLANAVAFGIGAVLNHHYPNWLESIGRGEALFGSYLGLIFGAQTLAFAFMARFSGWRYRTWPLLSGQLPLVLVLFMLPGLSSPLAILATAPWVGLALGVTYFASLSYSVDNPNRRGRNAGVHEAVLGIGSMVLPVCGGWLASASGDLEAPYRLAAVIGLGAIVVQGGILWIRRGPKAEWNR